MTVQLDIGHSEKRRIEAFLRKLGEQLQQHSFDWRSLRGSERIVDASRLATIDESLVITIICVKSYDDATVIAKANFLHDRIRWSQNGSIMYLVESSDKDRCNKVLNAFAGRE